MYDSSTETAAHVACETTAIRSTIASAHRAWAKGDGRTYAGCFAKATSDTTFFGLCRDGRAANAELHGALFYCAARGGTLNAEIEALEWLSADVALVRTASGGRAPAYQTYLMVRQADAWSIRSFQNTPVSPVASWVARNVGRRA